MLCHLIFDWIKHVFYSKVKIHPSMQRSNPCSTRFCGPRPTFPEPQFNSVGFAFRDPGLLFCWTPGEHRTGRHQSVLTDQSSLASPQLFAVALWDALSGTNLRAGCSLDGVWLWSPLPLFFTETRRCYKISSKSPLHASAMRLWFNLSCSWSTSALPRWANFWDQILSFISFSWSLTLVSLFASSRIHFSLPHPLGEPSLKENHQWFIQLVSDAAAVNSLFSCLSLQHPPQRPAGRLIKGQRAQHSCYFKQL